MYADSSQELCACLKLQFSNLPENTQIEWLFKIKLIN